MSSLESVRLKLQRAEKHLEVATRLIRWYARNKCTVERKPNAETNEIDVFSLAEQPAPLISAILGDAIHNMRSALDHVVYHLVLLNPDPAKPPDVPNERTMFPIADTREGFWRQVNELGRIRGVPDGACAIINRLQPYHARQTGRDYQRHPLWILNKLENIDKHRRLAVIAGFPFAHHATIRHPDGTITEHFAVAADELTVVPSGTKLWSFRPPGPGEGEMEVKGTLMSTVAFNEPDAALVNVDAAGILWQLLDWLDKRALPLLKPFC